MKPSIIIIDDEIILLKQLRRILEKEGYQVSTYSCPRRALAHMEQASFDLVISDIKMPVMDGMELMSKVKARFPLVEVILITGYASMDGAIEATKEGAFYYLEKPFNPEQLRDIVHQVMQRQITMKVRGQQGQDLIAAMAPPIVGESCKMRQIEATITQIGPSDCNVLITGDSGTGKELVARSLHANSERAQKPFIAFNCGALSETLLDNELFGHEPGAYTGANSENAGLLEIADGGTVFLDEIGEMPPAMQVKLLRVIQEKELMRVGGRRPIPVDVRIFSATAKDIKAEVKAGNFRKDLYYRINVVHMHLPPLSERKEDIPLLVHHFLNNGHRMKHAQKIQITSNAMSTLEGYAFPGNIRELENILERAVAVCHENVIRACDLPPDLNELELHIYQHPVEHILTLEDLERDYITHLLEQNNGARGKTANMLGIDRASLWRKMKKYNLD